MYLAQFDADDGAWVQAVAELHCNATALSAASTLWWDEVGRQLVNGTRIPNATVARRIAIDASRRLTQLVIITAPAVHEVAVRDVFARLTRLESLLAGSIDMPATREIHDARLVNFPPLQYAALDDRYAAGDLALACDFRVEPALDDLLADAALAGRELLYQLQARTYRATPDEMRAARKNALQVSLTPGARSMLVSVQENLATTLGGAVALLDEYVGVDSDTAAASAGAILQERFRTQFGAMGVAASMPRFEPEIHANDLSLALHRHDVEPLTPVELSACAMSAVQRDGLLAWRPSRRVESLLVPDADAPPDEPDALPPQPGNVPPPYDGGAAFGFVSYKRQDLERIAPIMDAVRELGVPLWYDRGIPGGTEWDAVIEDRLARCRFVLLFASRAAVASKYVRREVKYADAKDTPLLSVVLEETPLTHGMEMLLTQYQMLDVRAVDFARRLQHAVRGIMPA